MNRLWERLNTETDSFTQAWNKYWDMSCVELMVLGGDDANWINRGSGKLPYCVRQLDGFHLARSCQRGWKNGKEIYDTICSGAMWIGSGTGKPDERTGKTAEKSRDYVLKRLKKGVDWRIKLT